MAAHVYRFLQAHVDIARLLGFVGGAAMTLGSQSPIYFDVTADSTQLNDLSEILGRSGYSLFATDPGTTPTQDTSTALSVAGFDPRRILWRDHFITGNAGVSNQFGMMGWKTLTAGTGPDLTITAGTASHPGLARFEAGTSAVARAAIMLGDSAIANTIFIGASTQNQIDTGWVLAPRNTIAATDLERLQVGLGSEWTADAELANGLYWRYTPGTDTFYSLVAANGGARTVRASTTTPVVGTFVRLGAKITFPAGVPTVQAQVNGVDVGAVITTNIPAAAVSPGCMLQSVGGVVLEAMLDLDETYGYQDPA